MSLKSAINELNKAVKDLTSLHVQTFTGTLNLDVSEQDTFVTLKEQLKTAKTNKDVTLVAESLIKFDGDTYNFIAKDLEDVPPQCYDVHQKAVLAGLESRRALLVLFKDLLQ